MTTPSIKLTRTPAAPALLGLDATQSQAVAHRGSPLLIAGGPGTGKTSVLIEAALSRISAGQDPDSILLITYGRERASELRDAIALRTTVTMHEPLARTFHSLAYSILKMDSGDNYHEPILLSGPEQENFIGQLLEGDVIDGYREWPVDLHDGDDKKGNPLLTQGFIRELRDLIMRANERGISPDKLAALGGKVGEKYWAPAAEFWKRYKEISAIREDSAGDSKMRIDPSELINVAIAYLEKNEKLRAQLQARFATIMVDEFHESDPAQRRLLELLMSEDLVLVVDPKSAVGRFRGSDPDGVDAYCRDRFPNAATVKLETNHRGVPAKFAIEVKSESEEAQFIAHNIKRAHLIEGVAYSDMAIILRSQNATATAIRRALGQSGVPVAGDREAISSNAALAPFLLLARVAIGAQPLNLDTAERLLLSEFGGADSISLRRIRRAMIIARPEGDERSGTQLLLDAIVDGELFIEGADSVVRVHELLKGAKAIARNKTALADDLLWFIWDNAVTSDGQKLATTWRNQALRIGIRGAAADRDLDAMMQLFDSAARYSERFPLSGPAAFINEIATEDIAGDVITAKGVRPDFVEILTVHSAKGREWDLVAIAGLQEGVWPNLKQRSSLLGAERLVERKRNPDIPRDQLDVIAANGLMQDEQRLFHVALTRAKQSLFITAVQREDEEPSQFFEAIEVMVNKTDDDEHVLTDVPRPITAPALVAELRSQLDGPKAKEAAALLKAMSAEGIYLANPESWIGSVSLSTDAPVIDSDKEVIVSPSGAESFVECGVKWFLQNNGGSDGDSTAQVLGSAIHAFAAKMVQEPGTTREQLIENLQSSWKLIDPESGWVSASHLESAVTMLEKFVEYHKETKREVKAAELRFDVKLGRARIIGTVDRLEVEADGSLFIIDFKTGNTAISKEEAKKNLQLASYQLGVAEGGFADGTKSSGAELVYLGTDTAGAAIRPQYAIDLEATKATIETIGEGMGAATFFATVNKRCKGCPVRKSCPVQSDGRAVIE